jgi:hypothetical protein
MDVAMSHSLAPSTSKLFVRVAVLLGTAAVLAMSAFSPARAETLDQALSPAALVVAQLGTASPYVVLLEDFNQQTDPEHLLGLPGRYVAKAAFSDSTVDPSGEPTGVVEVFASQAALNARYDAVSTRGETDVPVGTILLRLVPTTPAATINAYQTALTGFAFR